MGTLGFIALCALAGLTVGEAFGTLLGALCAYRRNAP